MGKLVSVVIPCFNRDVLGTRAIESVKTANADEVEILLVDDGSARPYTYPKRANSSGVDVRVIRRSSNAGAGPARECGVRAATGSIILFLDSDDEMDAGWIDGILECLKQIDPAMHDRLIIVGDVFGAGGVQRAISSGIAALPPRQRLTCLRVCVLFFNPYYTSGLAISRCACAFSPTIRYCEDYFTMAMAANRASRIEVLPQRSCVLGRRPKSPGGISSKRLLMFWGEFLVRLEMVRARDLAWSHRVAVPLGMLYQCGRTVAQLMLHAVVV